MSGPGRKTGTDPGLLKRMVLATPGKGKPRIEIRDLKTRKLVKTIDLGSRNAHRAEKVLAGMYQRVDLDKYYVVAKCLDKTKC